MSKLKILGIVLLVIVSVLSLSLILDATITIRSKGSAWAMSSPDGTVEYGCRGREGECSITIDISPA